MWNGAGGTGGWGRRDRGRGEGKDVPLIIVIFLKLYVMKRHDTRKKSSKLTKISPKSRRNVLISFVVRREIRGPRHYVYAIKCYFSCENMSSAPNLRISNWFDISAIC